MEILGRYIGRELGWGIGVALAALLAIAYFVTFAGEMGHIGTHDFTTSTAVWYVLLKMPKVIQEMLPAAVLIGGLFAFGGMAASSELTVIRATGASVMKMLWQIRKLGYLLLLVSVINMEWVAPAAEQGARMMKAKALKQAVIEQAGDKFWLRDGEYFVRMDRVQGDGSVAGIRWMKIPQPGQLTEFSHAERAFHQEESWHLEQVEVTRIGEQRTVAEQYPELDHTSNVSEDLVQMASRRPSDLSAIDLFRYGYYMGSSGLDANSYWHAFWGRIAMPFGLVVMLMLALPFSITEGRSLSVGRRIMIGVFLGVGFYLVNRVLLNTGEIYQLNPVLTVFLMPGLFLGIAMWMIRRRGL